MPFEKLRRAGTNAGTNGYRRDVEGGHLRDTCADGSIYPKRYHVRVKMCWMLVHESRRDPCPERALGRKSESLCPSVRVRAAADHGVRSDDSVFPLPMLERRRGPATKKGLFGPGVPAAHGLGLGTGFDDAVVYEGWEIEYAHCGEGDSSRCIWSTFSDILVVSSTFANSIMVESRWGCCFGTMSIRVVICPPAE